MQEPNPAEPANYTGSYNTMPKQIADTKIAMSKSADGVIIYAVNIAYGTTITTAIQMSCLFNPRVSEEHTGGFRN
jgi:hypothetical protein